MTSLITHTHTHTHTYTHTHIHTHTHTNIYIQTHTYIHTNTQATELIYLSCVVLIGTCHVMEFVSEIMLLTVLKHTYI